jgi:tRNA (guanine37-N1)-methyltransferase
LGKLLRNALEGVIPSGQAKALETGIDIIGDIAIVKLDESVKSQGPAVGKAILESMKNVKAVFDQEGGLEGDFRLRKLRHVAGREGTLTLHKENQLRFLVDVEKTYFSPRLSTERLRIADLTQPDETVLNMFAGVGPYSNTISKRKKVVVYSNELNEAAYELHVRNNVMNKVDGLTRMYNADGAKLPQILQGARFDRILMPHPSQSNRFLAVALSMAKEGGWIHYYRHVSAYDLGEAAKVLDEELDGILDGKASYKSRRVREIGPRYIELVADIQVARP